MSSVTVCAGTYPSRPLTYF